MVGDRSHDVIGALQNRVFPAGTLWGYGSRSELMMSAGARRLLSDPAEIAGLAFEAAASTKTAA